MTNSDPAQLAVAQQAARTEQRVTTVLVGVLMAVGAWWLQNQFSTSERLSRDLVQVTRDTAQNHPDRDELKLHVQNLADRIEDNKIELRAIRAAIEARHPPGRTPLTGFLPQNVPDGDP